MAKAALLLASVVPGGCSSGAAEPGPLPHLPDTPRLEHTDRLHGIAVADPYRWLEDVQSPEVHAWAEQMDAYTRAWVGRHPDRDRTAGRIRSLAEARIHSAPMERGGGYFYGRFEATGAQFEISILMRDGLDGEERVLVDREEHLAATGRAPSRLAPSPTGRYLAYGSTQDGDVWETIQVLEVGAGVHLADSLSGIHLSLASLTWAPDDSGFYYQRFSVDGEGPGARVFDPRLYFHRLGTEPAADVLVHAVDAGANAFLSHTASPDGRWLVVSERRGDDPHNEILVGRLSVPGEPLVPLLTGRAGAFTFAGEAGGRLYFRTDLDAPNGRVVAVDPLEDPRSLVEVVPEDEHPISTWIGPAGPLGAAVVGDYLAVTHTADGRLRPAFFTLDGQQVAEWTPPFEGSLWSGIGGHPGRQEAFFSLSGLADPGTVYGVDPRTGESRAFALPVMEPVRGQVRTDRIRIPANDGAGVPAFVVRRSDTPLDGTAPVVLYGYGFGGWQAAPWYFPLMAHFVERGGVWVLAELRGDGGYGTAWHLAGRRENKARTFQDYLDVARWLIAERYTAADRLVANASSAGGPVAAAALLRSPELFGAGILDYPLLDLLRYEQFGYGASWVAEYGSASDSTEFEVLRGLSPYPIGDEARCLPPMLVAPGENDALTPPLHAYKFVAASRAVQECDSPILLRVSWRAGHAAGVDAASTQETWADQMAFLTQVLPPDAFRH